MLETDEKQLQDIGQVINVPPDVRMGVVQEIAATKPKTLVFTNVRNGLDIRDNPHCIGENVYVRLGMHDVISSEQILEEFEGADKGILVVPYAFNTGWRAKNISSIVFLNLLLNVSSADFRQAVERGWYPGPLPPTRHPSLYFINCDLA